MNDWFEWNGVRSTTYGMKVLTQPTIVRPTERVSQVSVPGRSGSLTLLEGSDVYNDITLACTCVIEDPARIASISSWLRGQGTIKFPIRSNGYYIGRVANQISFEKIVRANPHLMFQVQFTCKPYFYFDSGNTAITATAASTQLTNPGNVPSAPLLKVYGSGDTEGVITCGSSSMLITSFSNISYIYIDSEAKIAYKGSNSTPQDPLVLLGTRVSGDWLTIPDGNSYFTKSGGITSVQITPRWRCI